MRSGTKLRHILAYHSVDLSLNEEGMMELITIDKQSGDATLFSAQSFSSVVDKAYRAILKKNKLKVQAKSR